MHRLGMATVALLTLLAGVGVALPVEPNPMRVLAAIALVLVLPGYALTAALFSREELGRLERLLIVLGSSVSSAILTGLGLSAAGIALNWVSWGTALLGVTLGLAAVAWRRSPDRLTGARVFDGVPRLADRLARLDVRGALLFVLAAALVVLAIVVARLGALDQPQQTFTQLWMVPESGEVQLGVRNGESQPMTYSVVLRRGSTSLAQWPSVQLKPGETWAIKVSVPSLTDDLQLLLYRADAPDVVYRRVALAASPSPSKAP